MTSLLAYQIGGIFLLCAMLMWGTMGGFMPRALRVGKPASLFILCALLAFALYRFGPDMLAMLPSATSLAPDVTPSRPAGAQTAVPPPQRRISSPSPQREPAAKWKAPVISPSEPVAVSSPPAQTVAPERAEPAPAVIPPSQPEPQKWDSSDSSPYDSKTKRAIKAAGRFLHITKRKKDQDNP